MNRNRSVVRWTGRTLLALALAVGGLVVAPGAAFAVDFSYSARSLNLEASSGSGVCVLRDYPIPRGQWFSMRACLRDGSVAGSRPEKCGSVTQGVEP